jgi:hypothetical protein
MIQAGATSKYNQCDVQNMIRFIAQSINLEYWDADVDMVTQVEPFNHLQDRAKPSGGDRLGSIEVL